MRIWASLVAQLVKNLPAMQETWVWSLGWEHPWRRKRQPPPVFWPGELHGQRNLASYKPWDHEESDTTDRLTHTHTYRRINKVHVSPKHVAPYNSSCLPTLTLPRVVWEVYLRLEARDCVSLCPTGSDSKSTALFIWSLLELFCKVWEEHSLIPLRASGTKMWGKAPSLPHPVTS